MWTGCPTGRLVQRRYNEFYDCFSTSIPFHSRGAYAGKVFPDLIGPSIISVGQTIRENEDEDGFEVTLSFEGVFTGTSRKYDVTLEDADGSEIVAENLSFNKTAGTVTFALNNPSVSGLSSATTFSIVNVERSASQSTSNEFIEGGVTEPDWTWWHHTAESRAGNMVGVSFTIPTGPTLTNINADPNPSNLNEVLVTVTVSPISKGSFTLVVFDSSDPLKTVMIGPFSFTSSSSTPKTSSRTVLIHPSDELSYGKTYTVKTLSSSTLIVYHTGQTLTMPDAPPRISEATPTLTGLNKTFVTLSLSGAALPGKKDFGIVVKEMDGNEIKEGAEGIPLTGTIGGTIGSTETTCSVSEEIYNKTGTLEYSKKYKIISLSIVGFSCIVDVTATFEVPTSPGRVEKMMTPKLNGVKTEVSVVVTGVGLTSSISKIEVKRGDQKISSTSITFVSETELTATFQAGTLESGTELEFEKSYEIESVSGQSEVFLNAGVGFTVPAAGIVASTSTELNAATNEHFKVIVSGKNFVAGTKWNLKLTDRTEAILVTMSSATTGESSWVKGGGLNEIQFGSSYPVASMTQQLNDSEHLVCVGISLSPSGPALTDINADLNPSNLNEVIVNVTVSPISTGSFTLVVFDSSDSLKPEITIGPFSFTLSSAPKTSSHTVLIHPSDELSYGMTYTVKTLSSSTLIVYHTGQTLTMPDAPPRLSEATPTLTGLNKTFVTLSLSGAALPGKKDFGIVVKEMEGNEIKTEASEITLTGTIGGTIGSTETTCQTSVEIYTKTGTLEYSKKFKIISQSIVGFSCIVDVTATFEVPDSPGRVEKMITPKLNGVKTEVSVVVTGVGLTSSISKIEVKRGDKKISSTSITFVSETELTATFQAGTLESGTELEFEKSYEIESVSGQSEVFLNAGVGFTVPAAGIVASTSTELNAATNEHFKVIVSGKNFVAGTKWNLKLTGRTETILVTMSSASTGESSWVKAGGLNEIAFDSSYSILSMTNISNTSDILLSSGVSVDTPLASTLTNIKAEMNPTHSDEVILTLTSERIPAGSFTLLVNKTGDDQNTPISITPFTFSVSTTPIDSTLSLTIIPSGLLSCGETYTVHSLSSSSQIVSHSFLTFQVPSLLRSASASLNLSDCDEVFLSLTAFGFPSSTPITLTIVEVDEDDTPTNSPFTLTGTPSTKGDSTHILQTRVETAKLQHRSRFEIIQCDVTGRVIVLDGRVFFRVPPPPTLTGVDFSFATTSNTTFHLILNGKDLPVGETFLVLLDGFDEEIEVTFTTTSEGSSAELALGWSDTLQFDTAYPLVSVIQKSESSISIPSTHLTLQTKPRPNPLILYATDSENSNPKFCGAVDRPCSSVGVAWVIVDAYSAQRVSLVLMKKALLASQMIIESGQDIIIKQDLLPPTLAIPSTAALSNSNGLISVAGTLLLEKVNIDVQVTTLSFVLFDVSSGELTMDSVHISGVPSSSDVVDGIEGLCSWETGLIKLHDAEMETHSCEFSSIDMGEIWMESSNLSLISTQILSNGARFSLFPSAQQDVMCKSGNIIILPSSSDTSEDRWISSTSDCSVVLNRSEMKSPHFVPSLDVKNCRSTLSKKKDSFSVSIVGLKLIPCDLKLEVSESSSQSSKSNKDPVLIPLSFSSVESWNETNISLSVPSSSLSSLSSDEKWTARIVFGMNEHTDSFTFLESLKDRKAQALQESLPWLIPVIVCSALLLLAIVIVVIVLICRRRKAAKSDSEKLLDKQELNEVDDIKLEVEMMPYHTTNGVIAHKLDDPQTAMASDDMEDTRGSFHQPQARRLDPPVEALQCEGQFAVETVDGQDTLYNRIHKGDGVASEKRREIEKKIVQGMLKMVEKHNLEAGTRISPHWILLNRSDSVFIRVQSKLETKQDQDKSSHLNDTQRSASQSGLKNGIEEVRWRAPEQGEKEGEMKEGVEASKVMVFRLGLILWEIETGLVPLGELDAVNAHRNLAAGIGLPLQKVSDSSMRELIEGCLQIDADQRLTLQQVLSKLNDIPAQNDTQDLKGQFTQL
ncbi:hypothetical protein BLNAU_1940 [Blattamonas nauphoetae]|uniref:Serine-threonine/tyrosine-protein kinase catalytic domain-containing protein n=1 Tax=Blattamonas nauphoetae TaxID=2049346 RepID=A0ABQ9YGM9_9EUKA|nr:hypothetical protein BLNAU_1940 [Blattamonas nauphoetae]